MKTNRRRFIRTMGAGASGVAMAKGETMVLDDICEYKDDPDREGRILYPVDQGK